MTVQSYNAMLAAQNRCCAICLRAGELFAKGLVVDHCHVSGKVRALLCGDCNTSLGKFQDSPVLLARAIRYINAHAPS